MNPIPYGKQNISEQDIDEVVRVLRSDYLTQGPEVSKFENAFANYIGSDYAIAVSNGTAALHLSALALNVRSGDKVITTPITFSATANCIRYCGGEVVFVDIDPETYLIDLDKLEKLIQNSEEGTYAGVIPVDFGGKAVDLERLKEIALKYKLWIIEDACHAPGGYFTDKNGFEQKCGNGSFADLAIFSFHPVKHIASGEGGMITTNDKKLYENLLKLRSHGITRNPEEFVNDPVLASGDTEQTDLSGADYNQVYPLWYMEMQTLGYNYRLTDFQAALGRSQLGRAAEGLKRRHQIAQHYNTAFQGLSGLMFSKGQNDLIDSGNAFHLYIVQCNSRLALYNFLRTKNIFAQVHYFPVHLMPYYQMLGWKKGDFPIAEQYYKNCLSLPMYPSLTNEEVSFIIETVRSYFLLNPTESNL